MICKTTYEVVYMLGGQLSMHRTPTTAACAARAHARSGNPRRVGIIATDYPADGSGPLYRPLNKSEMKEADAAVSDDP